MDKPPPAPIGGTCSCASRCYAQAVMAAVAMRVVSLNTLWGKRLAALLTEHPKVNADRLGFPADWRNRPL